MPSGQQPAIPAKKKKSSAPPAKKNPLAPRLKDDRLKAAKSAAVAALPQHTRDKFAEPLEYLFPLFGHPGCIRPVVAKLMKAPRKTWGRHPARDAFTEDEQEAFWIVVSQIEEEANATAAAEEAAAAVDKTAGAGEHEKAAGAVEQLEFKYMKNVEVGQPLHEAAPGGLQAAFKRRLTRGKRGTQSNGVDVSSSREVGDDEASDLPPMPGNKESTQPQPPNFGKQTETSKNKAPAASAARTVVAQVAAADRAGNKAPAASKQFPVASKNAGSAAPSKKAKKAVASNAPGSGFKKAGPTGKLGYMPLKRYLSSVGVPENELKSCSDIKALGVLMKERGITLLEEEEEAPSKKVVPKKQPFAKDGAAWEHPFFHALFPAGATSIHCACSELPLALQLEQLITMLTRAASEGVAAWGQAEESLFSRTMGFFNDAMSFLRLVEELWNETDEVLQEELRVTLVNQMLHALSSLDGPAGGKAAVIWPIFFAQKCDDGTVNRESIVLVVRKGEGQHYQLYLCNATSAGSEYHEAVINNPDKLKIASTLKLSVEKDRLESASFLSFLLRLGIPFNYHTPLMVYETLFPFLTTTGRAPQECIEHSDFSTAQPGNWMRTLLKPVMKVVCPDSADFLRQLKFAAKHYILLFASSQLLVKRGDPAAVAEMCGSTCFKYMDCFTNAFARCMCRHHDAQAITDDVLRSSFEVLDDLNVSSSKLSAMGNDLCKSVDSMSEMSSSSFPFGSLDAFIDPDVTPETATLLLSEHQDALVEHPDLSPATDASAALHQLSQLIIFCRSVIEKGRCADAARTPKDVSVQALVAWLHVQTKIEHFMMSVVIFPEVSSQGSVTGVWTELDSEQQLLCLKTMNELTSLFIASTMVIPDAQNPAQTPRRAIVLGVAAAIIDCVVRQGGDDPFVKLIQNRVIATCGTNRETFESVTSCLCLTARQGVARDQILRYQKMRVDDNANEQPHLFQIGTLGSLFNFELKTDDATATQPGSQVELAVKSMLGLLVKVFGSKTPADALSEFCSDTLPGQARLQAIRDVSIHLAMSLSPTLIQDLDCIRMVKAANFQPKLILQSRRDQASIQFHGSCAVRMNMCHLAFVDSSFKFRPQSTPDTMIPPDESYCAGQMRNSSLCEAAVGYLPEALYPTFDDSLSTEASEAMLGIMGAAGLLKIQMFTNFLRQQAPGLLFNPHVQTLLQAVLLEGAAVSLVITTTDLMPLFELVQTLLRMAASSHPSPMSVTSTLSVVSVVVQVQKTIEMQTKTTVITFEPIVSEAKALIERWITIFETDEQKSLEEEMLVFQLHSFALLCDLRHSHENSTVHCQAVRTLSEYIIRSSRFSQKAISVLDQAFEASSWSQYCWQQARVMEVPAELRVHETVRELFPRHMCTPVEQDGSHVLIKLGKDAFSVRAKPTSTSDLTPDPKYLLTFTIKPEPSLFQTKAKQMAYALFSDSDVIAFSSTDSAADGILLLQSTVPLFLAYNRGDHVELRRPTTDRRIEAVSDLRFSCTCSVAEKAHIFLPNRRFASFFRYRRQPATNVFICRQSNGKVQHFISESLLRGVVPDAILQGRRFWASTLTSTIWGEPNKDCFGQYRVKLTWDESNVTQIKVERFDNAHDSQCLRLCTDSTNPLRAVLARFEPLAHCLIWKKSGHGPDAEVVMVEMPRHGLRYRLNVHGELASGDKTLLQDTLPTLERDLLVSMLPSFLVNQDSSGRFLVFVPLSPISPQGDSLPKMLQCGGFLQCKLDGALALSIDGLSVEASMLVFYNMLMRGHHKQAWQCIDALSSDEPFSPDQRFIVQWIGQFIEAGSLSGDSAACILAFVEATFLTNGETCHWNLSNVAHAYLHQLRAVSPCCIMAPEREIKVLGHVSSGARLLAVSLLSACLPGQDTPTNRLSFWLDWRVRCIQGQKSSLQSDNTNRFHLGVHIGGAWIRYQKEAAAVLEETSVPDVLEVLPNLSSSQRNDLSDFGMLTTASAAIAAGIASSSFYRVYSALSSDQPENRAWGRILIRMIYLHMRPLQGTVLFPKILFAIMCALDFIADDPAARSQVPVLGGSKMALGFFNMAAKLVAGGTGWNQNQFSKRASRGPPDELPARYESRAYACPNKAQCSQVLRAFNLPISNVSWTQERVDQLMNRPLSNVKCLAFALREEQHQSDFSMRCMPFESEGLPGSTAPAGGKMLARIQADMVHHACKHVPSSAPSAADIITGTDLELKHLLDALSSEVENSHITISEVSTSLTSAVNSFQGTDIDALKWRACQFQRPSTTVLDLGKIIMSTDNTAICSSLSFTELDSARVFHSTAFLFLMAIRHHLLMDAVSLAKHAYRIRSDALNRESEEDVNSEVNDALRKLSALHSTILVSCLSEAKTTTAMFDPRVLVFQYVAGKVLRVNQIAMARDMVNCVLQNASTIKQGIMGSGKTRVILPLVVFMLIGAGQRVHVAALDRLRPFTSQCIKVLSVPLLRVRVVGFIFDRTTVSGSANGLARAVANHEKLSHSYSNDTAVVFTSSAIKSLFLRHIELKSQYSADIGSPAVNEAASHLGKILKLWKSQGSCLLMDEVDELLNPLKSELRFPTGSKVQLDCSDERAAIAQCLLGAFTVDATATGPMQELIAEGIKSHHLQCFPHLLMADASYWSAMLPTMATKLFEEYVAPQLCHRDACLVELDLAAAGVALTATSCRTAAVKEKNLSFTTGGILPVLEGGALTHYTAEMASPHNFDDFWCSELLPCSSGKECEFSVQFDLPRLVAALELEFVPVSFFMGHTGINMMPDKVQICMESEDGGVFETAPHNAFNNDKIYLDASTQAAKVRIVMTGDARWFGLKTVRIFEKTKENGVLAPGQGVGLLAAPVLDEEALCDLPPRSCKIVRLAHTFLNSIVPHCLQKINTVSFGLIPDDQAPADKPLRQQVAVPFVSKDCPSERSEFAHPDVVVTLTTAAYMHSGLRRSDVTKLHAYMKSALGKELGPVQERASFIQWQSWIAGSSLLPLHLFDTSDAFQMALLLVKLSKLKDATSTYLRKLVFPNCLQFRRYHFTASGEELGSRLLFPSRCGFSGTPSSLVPVDMGRVEFESGSEGSIVSMLCSQPSIVASVTCVQAGWDPESLLKDVASCRPAHHALIDAGALITGFASNFDTAKFLLASGLKQNVVVFVNERTDEQLAVCRGQEDAPMPLHHCLEPLQSRFVFFDAAHCTGIDITQTTRACAAVTLGKDLNIRDYSQASWRMRGLGIGQTLAVFLIPEVRRMVAATATPCAADIVAWLLGRSLHMENIQASRLLNLHLKTVSRLHAIDHVGTSVQATDAFVESHVKQFEVAARVGERPKTAADVFNKGLAAIVKADLLQTSQQHAMVDAVSDIHDLRLEGELIPGTQVRAATFQGVTAKSEGDFDCQVENEQEQQVMIMPQGDDKPPLKMWPGLPLAETDWSVGADRSLWPVYPLRKYSAPGLQVCFEAPEYIQLSRNHTAEDFDVRWERRLKDVNLVLVMLVPGSNPPVQMCALSFREADMMRREMTNGSPQVSSSALLNISSGSVVFHGKAWQKDLPKETSDYIDGGVACLKLFNCSPVFTLKQLSALKAALAPSSLSPAQALLFLRHTSKSRRRQSSAVPEGTLGIDSWLVSIGDGGWPA